MVGIDCTRIQPPFAYAANILELSEQIPAKVIFLTEDPDRMVKIGATTIGLQCTAPKNMAIAGRFSSFLVQPFRKLRQRKYLR